MTKLYVPSSLCEKMMTWVNVAKGEVCGIGRVSVEKGDFYLQDVWLLEQTASPAEAEFSAEGLAELLVELAESGDDLKGLYFWWHSHVNMTASFSGIDYQTMSEWQGPYVLAFVINKSMEQECILYVKDPIPTKTVVETCIQWGVGENREELEKEFKEKVTEKVTTVVRYLPTKYTGNRGNNGKTKDRYHYGGYNDYYGYDYDYYDIQAETSKYNLDADELDDVTTVCIFCPKFCDDKEFENCFYILEAKERGVEYAINLMENEYVVDSDTLPEKVENNKYCVELFEKHKVFDQEK